MAEEPIRPEYPAQMTERHSPVIYSTTCAYAMRAMARLAKISPEGYMRIQEVCEGTDLPAHFVAKIFRHLVRGGVLVSARGRGGGFALARSPDKITLYDIVGVIDGVQQYTSCVTGLKQCSDENPCSQHHQFKPVRSMILNYLQTTTLAQLGELAVQTPQTLVQLGQPAKD